MPKQCRLVINFFFSHIFIVTKYNYFDKSYENPKKRQHFFLPVQCVGQNDDLMCLWPDLFKKCLAIFSSSDIVSINNNSLLYFGKKYIYHLFQRDLAHWYSIPHSFINKYCTHSVQFMGMGGGGGKYYYFL